MLRVLGRPTSINVRKVLWTLDEIGAPYVHEAQWATSDHPTRSPEFLALNPNGLVPVIVDEAGVLAESNTICRYMAGKHGRDDLLPADPWGRARVETWMDWQATELNGAWGPVFLSRVRNDPAWSDAEIARSVTNWAARMHVLEDRLNEGEAFLAGPQPTLADIVVGLSVHRYRSTPDMPALGPATVRYMEALDRRPAARAHLAPSTP